VTDTGAVLINTEDHSLICYSFVSLMVWEEGKQKSIHARGRNMEKLQRWTLHSSPTAGGEAGEMENHEVVERTHRPMKTPLQMFCSGALPRKYIEQKFLEEKVFIKLKS